jgi:Ca-activated chloride channel family protein
MKNLRVSTHLLATAATAAALFSPSLALAWDPLHRPNPDVEEGNAHLRADRGAEALEAYGRAARALPDAPEIPLDRGLALLATGDLEAAEEAFLEATKPPASPAIRAAAYYDRGIALMRQAEALAEQEDHRGAQGRFRVAAESFRRSLAAGPGNRDAAWNLELALRRLHEEQEEQEQQEQEQQDQQQQDQQDQQQQDQQQQDQQQQDQQQQDQQPQDQQPQDQQPQDQEPQVQDQHQQGKQPQDQQDQQPQGQEPQEQDPQQPGQQTPSDATEGPRPEQVLPEDARRILDSLEDGEENLERLRARSRANREHRVPTKDW